MPVGANQLDRRPDLLMLLRVDEELDRSPARHREHGDRKRRGDGDPSAGRTTDEARQDGHALGNQKNDHGNEEQDPCGRRSGSGVAATRST